MLILDYKVIQEKDEWNTTLNEFKEKDINFEYDYLNLYTNEGEKPMMVYMRTDIGKIVYVFMLRDIAFHSDLGDIIEKKKYFDISTPYGFGGHLIETDDIDNKTEIIKVFYDELFKFYKEHNVVSEYIRFSPIIKNHEYMEKVVDVIYSKKFVNIDFESCGENTELGIKRRRRQSVHQAKAKGMKTVFELSPKSFDKQLEIYYDTMNRKGASEAFLFSREYFEKMLHSLSEKLLITNVMLEDKIISFGLALLSEGIIYALVAGTNREYMKCSPSDVYYADTIKWGYENKYKHFLLGGGLTSSEDDSLYSYKKSFSIANTEVDFYIGKKIWNQEDYDYLVSVSNRDTSKNSSFFPQYREY